MSTIAIASGCAITRRTDGSLAVRWDNGHALNTITGASVDYIEPHMRMAGTLDDGDFEYNFDADIARMIRGGVPAKLSFLVASIRKVVTSMESCSVNLVECFILPADAGKANIPVDDWKKLVDNAAAVTGVINQSLTILGLNGLSMLLKGHNWIETDSIWGRLQTAVGYDAHFETLGVADWEARIFHDACHPFALEWKTALVVRDPTPLAGHINGVLVKRMPAIPAGTTLVFVTHAAITDLVIVRPDCEDVLMPFKEQLMVLQARIISEPLHWCIHFTTSRTGQNLAIVNTLEESCAFVYGMCTKIFDRKSTLLKAAAFKANGGRHSAQTALGASYAEGLEAKELTADQVQAILQGPIARGNELLHALPDADTRGIEFKEGNVAYAADDDDAEDPLGEAEAAQEIEGAAPSASAPAAEQQGADDTDAE